MIPIRRTLSFLSQPERWIPVVILVAFCVLALNRYSQSLPRKLSADDDPPYTTNLIVNGDFDLWDPPVVRNPPAYAPFAGNWHLGYDGSNVQFTASRQSDPTGRPYLRLERDVTAQNQHYNNLEYFVPGATYFANRTATVSFRARLQGSATGVLGVRLAQDVRLGKFRRPLTPQLFKPGDEWARYSATFFLPALDPQLIEWPNYLMLFFELPLNEPLSFEITDVQLEYGSRATPFQRP